ncbi:MAG: hypothetical protein R8F63_05635 [Acidimicrobiales bacterium]|nr:hypothetical protein [Acidimicrobiales bacterium]
MSPTGRLLAAFTVLHAAVGAWIATSVAGPMLAIDDIAFLSMGRTLAGDGAAAIGAQPPYGILYPLLLAPGWFVGLDESQMVVYAQVGNAILGALLIPVLYALVRRLTRAARSTAITGALVGASLPAALLTGSIVWTERLLPLLVALGLLGVTLLHERVTGGRVALVVVVAIALFATHPRTGAAAVVLIVAAVGFAFRAGQIPASVTAAALGISGLRLAEVARAWVADAAFDSTGTYDAGDLVSRRGIDDIPHMAIHAGGTVAYLVLATAGLAILGALVITAKPQVAKVVAGIGVGIVVVAGWFLTGVDRSDAWLHGRYIEILAPPLVALGIVGAKQLPWRISATVIAAGGVVAGFYGAWAGPGNNWQTPRSPVMMLGTEVSGAPFGGNFFEPGAAASAGIVVGLLLLAALQWRNRAALAVAGTAITLAVFSGLAALDDLQQNSVVGQVQASPVADADIDLLVIDVDRVPRNLAAAVAYEVGLDRAQADADPTATHLLLEADTAPPPGATLLAEFEFGSVWTLG